jgi:pimeloyl-ACP methyl ester carboxylesterase
MVGEIMVKGCIPLMTIMSPEAILPHDLLIIYGGTKEQDFRQVVRKEWGEPLAGRGFSVHCFDFQSNLPVNNFYDFGLWDRTLDATKALDWLLTRPYGNPMTLIGVSMGGHIATQLAGDFGDSIANLILVAPAAYPDEAIRPGLKFSPTVDGEFTRILRRPDGWRESSIFTLARQSVRARPYVIAFQQDEVVGEVPFAYFEHFVRGEAETGRPSAQLTTLAGGHAGIFTDPERIKLILGHIFNFLVPMSA